MKTYEDFLTFLDDHLKRMTDFIPAADKDFHSVCCATGRFLLAEPYRWESILEKWLQPPEVPEPNENELFEFFKHTQRLSFSFKKELEARDLPALHKAYKLLYTVLILKDEFIGSIFRDDAKARRYKKIFKDGDAKIARIKNFILKMVQNQEFVELMRKFTKDLQGYSLTLINNKKLLDQAIVKIAES